MVSLNAYRISIPTRLTRIAIDDADSIIRTFHLNLHSDEEKPLLPDLTPEEKEKLAEAEKELSAQKEKRQLEDAAEQSKESPSLKRARMEIAA